jgi:hypothetical protein
MRLPLDEKICDFDGNELPFKGKPLTLRAAIVDSLASTYADERALPNEEKVKRYKLAKKVHNAKPTAEFTIEQTALMKDFVGKNFTPLIVGACFELIEAGCNATLDAPQPMEAE